MITLVAMGPVYEKRSHQAVTYVTGLPLLPATNAHSGIPSTPKQPLPLQQQLKSVRYLRQTLYFVLLTSAAALAQSPATPLFGAPSSEPTSYQPITSKQRLQWFVTGTVGPESLTAGLFTAGFSTALNHPREYGPHWDGYGKRYGMRLTGISTSNAIEAELGSLWGEDPRYFDSPDRGFGGRVKHAFVMTFAAYRPDGKLAPAYARFVAIPANNFISNSWRADSEANTSNALARTGWGFLGRLGSNTFAEFWPTVQRHVLHRNK